MTRLKSPVLYTLLILASVFVTWVGHSGQLSLVKHVGGVVTLILVAASPIVLLMAERRASRSEAICRFVLGSLIVVAISFAAGEVALRLFFWQGESFSNQFGPMVQRFEKEFQFNRYDGPSRGPSITDSEPSGGLRVLVQGDSITWGQGVRDEDALYTTRLLRALRQRQPDADMAVLARPGREIDGHLEQLAKWGAATRPDVIVYQWYVNDIEVDRSRVSKRQRRLWQRLFVHDFLARNSYFWFFLDYHLTRIFSNGAHHYLKQLEDRFGVDKDGWKKFAELFSAWSENAKTLTPRVLVFLYPLASNGPLVLPEAVADIHERMHILCVANNVTCVEAIDWFKPLGSHRDLWASLYDQHPNAHAHDAMAIALEKQLLENWPELFP